MNRTKGAVLVMIPLIMLSSVLTLPQGIPPAYATPPQTTGIVCIADPTGSMCPETPPILTPASPSDTQLTIGVFLNNSATWNGFDVILVADHTIIKPWKIDLTNSIIPGGGPLASITVECIGGVAKAGTSCRAPDGPNTLDLVAVGSGQSPLRTGLLFAATYNITGTTRNTPIDFKRGPCPTSPTSETNVCVAILTGTPQPAPETIQNAGFSNLPFYAIDASPATLVTDQGASNSSTITLTSLNGFIGTVTVSGAVNPAGPGQSLFPTSAPLSPGIQGLSTLTVAVSTAVAPGSYNVTVTASTNSSFPTNPVIVHVIVPPPDYSISSTPSTVTINATTSGTAKLTLTSLNSFAGTVSLSVASASGLVASLNATQLKLKPGGSNSSATLTVSASTGGTYTATVTATSGQITHQLAVSVIAIDFGIASKMQSISIPQGVNQSYTFTVTNDQRCCYLGNVTLSTAVSPFTGLTASCGPSLVVFTSRITSSVDVNCGFKGVSLGDYNVILGGIGRGGKLFHAVVLVVHVQAPDFTVTASPQSQTVQAGSTANITVSLGRQSTFNGTLNVSTSVSPSTLTAGLNASSVIINNSRAAGGVALSVAVPLTFRPGLVNVTLTVVNGTLPGALSHQIIVGIIVAAPSSFHDVSVVSVTTDTTSSTIGDKVKYTIVVFDLGSFPEQATVLALVGDTTVDQKNVTIQPGGNATVTLTWDTSTWTAGTYVIGAKVLSVPGEKNTGNNLIRSTATVNVNARSQGVFSQVSDLALPIGILVAIVAVIGVSVYLLRYRARARKQSV